MRSFFPGRIFVKFFHSCHAADEARPSSFRPFRRHTARFLTIWLTMLPLGRWDRYHWSMLPVIALIGFLLLGIGKVDPRDLLCPMDGSMVTLEGQ
jgi:hypothetical protein